MTWNNVPAYRVSLEGHLGAAEIFATTFWCAQSGAGAADPLGVANQIVTALGTNGTGTTTILSRLKGLLATADGWGRVRVYSYAPGSHLAAASGVAAISGGAGTNSRGVPFQCTLVATLKTAQAGRSARGRMYLPYGGGVAAQTGLCLSSTVDSAANAIGDLFGWIKNNATAPLGPVQVWSPTKDQALHVTTVQVDSKLDIQRRRAVKLQPDYVKVYAGL